MTDANERERGSALLINRICAGKGIFLGRNIRVSSDVWRLISVWKTDGYIKWLNLLLVVIFAFRAWVISGVWMWRNSGKAQRESVPRASALFLNSSSRSFFKKGLETLCTKACLACVSKSLDSAVPVTSVTTGLQARTCGLSTISSSTRRVWC